jgi:DeoR family glycerol-3-phosphate regulon repressor
MMDSLLMEIYALIENGHSNLNMRQQEILKLVREMGYVSIDQLAEKFGVSQQTVRRDIIFLNDQQLVQRHHGGAALPPGKDRLAYPSRKGQNSEAKEAIGRMIAAQIPNGASVFIDIGTTMAAVAESLSGHQNLKIITNHIDVVYTLCEKTDFEIILTGGLVRNRDRAIWDESTAEFLRRFRVGFGIFGVGSLTDDGQLLDYHYRDAQASRAAMEISRVKFAGFDHSKMNANALMPFAHVSELDGIFTDKPLPPDLSRLIKGNGVELFFNN